jgi:hypothetical protein
MLGDSTARKQQVSASIVQRIVKMARLEPAGIDNDPARADHA